MKRLPIALLTAWVGGFSIAGCGPQGRPTSTDAPAVIGPKVVLLRTPDSVGHTSFEMSVAFSPDGKTVAAGRVESFHQEGKEAFCGTVVWDLEANRELAVMKAHTRSVCGVAISPDGTSVASASDGPIVGHTVYGLFSMGVACGPDYGIVRLFDLATGKQRAGLKHDWTARSVAFSPDWIFLASGGGGAAKLWDLATNKALCFIKVEDDLDVYCVAFSSDGQTLAIGVGSRDFDGSYGEVRLWDMSLGGVRAVLKGEAGKIRSLAFAPDGKSLVTGSRQAVACWEVPRARGQSGGEPAVSTYLIGNLGARPSRLSSGDCQIAHKCAMLNPFHTVV